MALQGEIPFHQVEGKDKCFWLCSRHVPSDTTDAHFFSTDEVLIYDPYYGDFGPLNISQLCRYSRLMSAKIADPKLADKRIYHVCKPQTDTRANSILLATTWGVICHNKAPRQAYQPFANVKPALVPYRDASLGPPSYPLTVEHCLSGLAKGISLGWYNHETFDPDEYEHYERVENGDFNWIVPGKFLAFSGPTQTPIAYVDGVKTNTPETYFDYFRKNNVTGVVRFNNKVYDRKKFLDAQFNHYDLYFADGGNPTEQILKRFLEIVEAEPGALAVHCKAGLGRTGTLISLFLMKHFFVTTPEIISWLRLCRPGSVIGPQQNFLAEMEARMHEKGRQYQKEMAARGQTTPGGAAPMAGEDDAMTADMGSCSVSAGGRPVQPTSPNRSAAPPSPNLKAPRTGNGFGMAAAPAPARSAQAPGRGPPSPVRKPGGVTSLLGGRK